MPIPLAVWLGLGAFAGSQLQRAQSRADIRRQNEYNDPVSQLERLRAANLPYAAMTDSISGNQSQLPESENSVLRGIEQGLQATMMKKQMELTDAQIKATEQQAEQTRAATQKTWVEALRQKTASDKELDSVYNYDLMGGDGLTLPQGSSNQVANLVRQQQASKVEQYLKHNQSEAIQLEMDVKRAKLPHEIKEIKTRINNMINEMGIRTEDLKIRQGMYPLQQEETRQRIGNLKLEAGMYPIRYHQGIISNQILEQQRNANSVLDSLINSMKKDGMSLEEAFFHSIFTGKFNINPLQLRMQ